jgi:hypothetical protein
MSEVMSCRNRLWNKDFHRHFLKACLLAFGQCSRLNLKINAALKRCYAFVTFHKIVPNSFSCIKNPAQLSQHFPVKGLKQLYWFQFLGRSFMINNCVEQLHFADTQMDTKRIGSDSERILADSG